MPTPGCCHGLSQCPALEGSWWEAAASFTLCPITALSGAAWFLLLLLVSSQGLRVNGGCPPGYQVCSLPAALRGQGGGPQPRLPLLLLLPLLGAADPDGAVLAPSDLGGPGL